MSSRGLKTAFCLLNTAHLSPAPGTARALRLSLSYSRSRTFHVGSAPISGHCVRATAAVAVPFPPGFAFDKIPKKLPDWWEEDDDDDDDEEEKRKKSEVQRQFQKMGGGGNGDDDGGNSGGGGGRGDGDGDGDDKGFFNSILLMYTYLLSNYAVPTKAVTTSVLAVIGDLIAQRISVPADAFEWDRQRTFAIGLWGLVFMGPVLHAWYAILNRTISGKFSVIKKVVLDQILFAPMFNSAFLFGTGLLEKKPLESVRRTWSLKFKDSMIANWMIWPFAQAINFQFIPRTYQVVFVNFVALLWNAILTYISHDDHPEQANNSKLRQKNNLMLSKN